jgi:hypothetical protein
VSDADWIEHSLHTLGWMVPGDIKVFETDELHEAKMWLVGLDDDDD